MSQFYPEICSTDCVLCMNIHLNVIEDPKEEIKHLEKKLLWVTRVYEYLLYDDYLAPGLYEPIVYQRYEDALKLWYHQICITNDLIKLRMALL